MSEHKRDSIRRRHAPQLQEDRIVYYPLPDLLEAGQQLAFQDRLGLLSLLAVDPATNLPRLFAQEQFSFQEIRVLVPLLENYPDYCPHEVMFANFYNGSVTEKTIARARERLQEAQFAGVWDYELRPVRNVLSRTRQKLSSFGIDIRSILETGYLLKPLRERGNRGKERRDQGEGV